MKSRTRKSSFFNNPAVVSAFMLATAIGGCGDNSDDGTDPGSSTLSIVDVVADESEFSTLAAALEKAELDSVLMGDGPFTVFAPTNEAFAASGITSLDAFSVEELKNILLYHVISGESITAASVSQGPADMAADLTAFFTTDSGVAINGGNQITGGAEVVTPDIEAMNGIIHTIDRVLLPPDLTGCAIYGGLTALVDTVEAAAPLEGGASVLETLQSPGPLTVFAPTNSAFESITAPSDAAAIRDILLYHALGGAVLSTEIPAKADSVLQNEWNNGVTLLFASDNGVMVNNANVVLADIKCTNGIVHVIDDVLIPPTVVDIAGIAGLSSLVDAVVAADPLEGGLSVVDALSADAPYTVFAPTNEAFTAQGPVEDTQLLRDILLLHVVNAGVPVLAADIPPGADSLLPGEALTFNAAAPSVSSTGTADANIVLTDINVTNGVVHVIDAVLLPVH